MGGRLAAPPYATVVDRADQGAPVARRAPRVWREEGPHRRCRHRSGRGGTQGGRRQGHRPPPPSPEAGSHWGGRARAGRGTSVVPGKNERYHKAARVAPQERVGPRQGGSGGLGGHVCGSAAPSVAATGSNRATTMAATRSRAAQARRKRLSPQARVTRDAALSHPSLHNHNQQPQCQRMKQPPAEVVELRPSWSTLAAFLSPPPPAVPPSTKCTKPSSQCREAKQQWSKPGPHRPLFLLHATAYPATVRGWGGGRPRERSAPGDEGRAGTSRNAQPPRLRHVRRATMAAAMVTTDHYDRWQAWKGRGVAGGAQSLATPPAPPCAMNAPRAVVPGQTGPARQGKRVARGRRG